MINAKSFLFPAAMIFLLPQQALAQDCSAQQAAWEQALEELNVADDAIHAWNGNYDRNVTIIYNTHYSIVQGCQSNYVCITEADDGRDRLMADLDYEGVVLQQNYFDKQRVEAEASVALGSCQAGWG